MRNMIYVLATVFVCMSTVGCVTDLDTPQGALAVAYSGVKKQNLKKFRKALTGLALEQYGTSEELGRLHERLSGVENIRLADVQLLSEERVGETLSFVRHYQARVEGDDRYLGALVKNVQLFTTTIVCDVSVVRYSCDYVCDESRQTICRISALE